MSNTFHRFIHQMFLKASVRTDVGWLVVFYVPWSTAKDVEFGFYTVPPGNEPWAVAWQSITLPLRHASSTRTDDISRAKRCKTLYVKFYYPIRHIHWDIDIYKCFAPLPPFKSLSTNYFLPNKIGLLTLLQNELLCQPISRQW